jgi:hypothetical protein
MVLTNGQEELSDPFELEASPPADHPLHRPRSVDRRQAGAVRPGPLCPRSAALKNYWRSVRAEILMLRPRHNFIAPASASRAARRLAEHADLQRRRAGPVQTTAQNLAALHQRSGDVRNDMKETTGIHEAELGMKSNETSGVAIRQRQQQGDLATIIYHDNMNAAMQEAGEVLNALIPIVYDTARTIRTVGVDEGVKLLRVNDPNAEEQIDLAEGRYDVTVTTGPAYATRRQEAAAQLMQLASQNEQFTQVAGDLIIDTLDIPNGEKIRSASSGRSTRPFSVTTRTTTSPTRKSRRRRSRRRKPSRSSRRWRGSTQPSRCDARPSAESRTRRQGRG